MTRKVNVFRLRKQKVHKQRGTQTHIISHKSFLSLVWILQFYIEFYVKLVNPLLQHMSLI